MAGLTNRGGINMRRTFTRGTGTIMATRAGFAGQAVIEYWHQPITRGMASFASQRCRDVIQTLADRSRRVVATLTTAQSLSVIDGNQRKPCCVGVAGFTHIAGINVRGTFANGGHTVMASHTTVGNTGMIKGHDSPIRRDVTGVARIGGHNMRGLLTDGDNAVVTAHAGANDLRMIHRIHGLPAGRRVAGLAQIRCQNMIRPLAGGDHTIMASDTSAQHFCVIHRCGR